MYIISGCRIVVGKPAFSVVAAMLALCCGRTAANESALTAGPSQGGQPTSPSSPEILYDVLDVTHLGGDGTFTTPNVLDDAGGMAGTIYDLPATPGTPGEMFLWDGVLHRFRVPEGVKSVGVAAIAGGRVAGSLQKTTGEKRAFVTSGQDLVELPSLAGDSWPAAMNASGAVAGFSTTASGEAHLVVWTNGVLSDLNDPLSGVIDNAAISIDDVGSIRVVTCASLGPRTGCRSLTVVAGNVQDNGPVANEFTASAMNPNGIMVGQMVGQNLHTASTVAGVWMAGNATSLKREIASRSWPELNASAGNELGSSLRAVNTLGDAVGEVDIPISEGGAATAILWKDGKLIDLSAAVAPATKLFVAYAINARGQILAQRGEYPFPGGVFLLVPR